MTGRVLPAGSRYSIVRQLGEGGLGRVYLARDAFQGGRLVALKVLRPGLLDAPAVESFRAEFGSLARLRHPHLAEVFDFGIRAEDGAPFLTMEYVDGRVLSTLGREAAWEHFDGIAAAGLRALDYIHSRGWLHNDIKPQNILIGEPFLVKLLDFGLARRLSAAPQYGVSGTLHYIAPERLAGAPGDPRSDLYSLGAVLYQVLTGKAPFDDGTAGQVVGAILAGEIEAPRSVDPAIPPRRAEFVERLMALAASDRPASAADAFELLFAGHAPLPGLDTPETIASFVATGDLVGRDDEMATLREWTEAHAAGLRGEAASAVEAPVPRMVLVSGPEGSGKSRLVRELRQQMQMTGMHLVTVRCFESATSPLQPFRDLLQQARSRGGLSADQAAALDQALGAPSHAPPAPLPAKRGRAARAQTARFDRAELTALLADCLDGMAPSIGGVLILEDLHWADAPALDLLRHLMMRDERSPWLLLATRRDDPAPTAATATFERQLRDSQKLRRMPLAPLTLDQIAGLLASMLPWNEPPERLAALLLASTGGLPLHLEETLKSLVAGGFLERHGVGWRLRHDTPEALPVPGTLAAMALAQIKGLDGPEVALARMLAVFGRPTSLDVVTLALARIDPAHWDGAATRRSAGMLERLHLAGLDQEENGPLLISLVQSPTRAALYETTPAEERAAFHGAAAAAIEEAAGGAVEERVEELARHYSAAGDRPRATDYLLRAALRAEALFDPVRQTGLLRSALELMPPGDPRRPEALDRLAFAMVNDLGDHSAGLEWARQQEIESRRARSRIFEIHALRHQSWALGFLGQEKAALECARRALTLARAARDRREVASCLAYLGLTHARGGRHAEAIKMFDEAVPLARGDDARALIWVLNNAALCRLGSGDFDAAGALLSEVLETARHHRMDGVYHRFLANFGTVRLDQGDLNAAIEALEEALRWARRHTILEPVALQSESLSVAYMLRGRVDRAGAMAEEAARVRRGLGENATSLMSLDLLGQCALVSGRIDDAIEMHRQGVINARERRDRIQEGYHLASLAADLHEAEEPMRARSAAADARRIGQDLEHARITFLAERGLAIAASRSANRREASALIGRIRKAGDTGLRAPDRIERQRLLGVLATAAGRLSEAETALTAGLEAAATGGFRELEWRLHAARAELLQARGLPVPSTDAYHEAYAIIRMVAAEIEESAVRDDYLNHPRRSEVAHRASDQPVEPGRPATEVSEPAPAPAAATTTYPSSPTVTHRRSAGAASQPGAGPGGADPQGRMLTTLFEITQIINGIHEPDVLLDKVMDLAIELVGAERGLIFLWREDGTDMDLVVERRVERKTIKDATEYSRSILLEAGRGRSILSHDAGHDARFRSFKSVAQLGIRSLMCVPLALKGRTLGTVYVDTRAPGVVFTPESLKFLEAFAAQAAVAVENARLFDRVQQENTTLRQAVTERYGFENIIGRSTAMRDVFNLLTRVAPSGLAVMIRGESGTGKEMVARAIHLHSARKERPFCTENCAALPDTLLESALFGHTKGAYTGADTSRKGLFEHADGGTLFLDEVGDMSMAMQSKLLRVLQNGEVRPLGSEATIKVNVRVVSATNRDLEAMMRQKTFREDLYFRLKGISITLPPLRDRREDIPLLVNHFLAKLAKENGSAKLRIDPPLLAHLGRLPWPGNVRELENQVYRLALFASEGTITQDDAKHDSEFGKSSQNHAQRAGEAPLTRSAMNQALKSAKGKRDEAARLLGISRATFFRKMRELGVDSSRGRKPKAPGTAES